MSMNDHTKTVESRLASVFAEVFSLPPDRVHSDLDPDKVEGWDSLGHVMLIAAIEAEFSIQFDVDQIMDFTSFQTVLSVLDKAVHERVAT